MSGCLVDLIFLRAFFATGSSVLRWGVSAENEKTVMREPSS